jgi:hypothetical protein
VSSSSQGADRRMSRKNEVIALVVGVFLLGLAPNASTQSGIPMRALPGVTSTLSGTVVSSITTALVLRDDGGVAHTFSVDSTSALPAGLVPGMRVNVTFEVLKGGGAHLVSVGTSYAMDVSEVESQPQERKAATPRPSAEPKAAPPPTAALSTFGLGESASGPNTRPATSEPANTEPGKGEPANIQSAKSEPTNTEPPRPAATPSLQNVLVIATLLLGAGMALWWARSAL